MLLLSHPTGNPRACQTALALEEASVLGEFWTCVASPSSGAAHRRVVEELGRQGAPEMFPHALSGRVRAVPLAELLRPAAGHGHRWTRLFSPGAAAARRTGAPRRLDQRAAQRVVAGAFSGVYAYEGAAEQVLEAARTEGLTRLYEMPRGNWAFARRLFAEEAAREPAWADTLCCAEPEEEQTEQVRRELAHAETVIVPCRFALDTLETLPPGLVPAAVALPYGAPLVRPAARCAPPRWGQQPLRVLFVGTLTQRKGLSYLLAACAFLGRHVSLTLVGPLPRVVCPALESALIQHRWHARLPPERMREEWAQHDVLVLPSLYEGFGAVLLEAMAHGLPVITTPHTAGPDLVDEGVEGFIVPIRSVLALAERLEVLLLQRGLARAMGVAAQARAAAQSWEAYREDLAACTVCALASR